MRLIPAGLGWWLLSGCRPVEGRDRPPEPHSTPAPVPTGDRVEIVVEDGEGDGRYPSGATVFVAATVDPTTEIVTGWHASPTIVPPADWNGTIEVPTEPLVLGADVLPVDATLVDRTFALPGGDHPTRLVTVAEPRGVVMFFHGASYSTRQLDEPAPRSVLLHLVHAGYTVVAPASTAELVAGSGGWDATAGSDDLRTVEDLWSALEADGLLPAGALRVAWGMSSGGQFAHVVGSEQSLDAVLAHCAGGTPAVVGTSAATGWYLAERDQTFPTAVGDSLGFQATLEGRGVPTDRYVHPRTPVTPLRFTRVPGVDDARSESLRQTLLDRGLAGEDGLVSASGADLGTALSDVLASDPPAVRTGILAELEILAADHEVYDDAALRMVAFLATVRGR